MPRRPLLLVPLLLALLLAPASPVPPPPGAGAAAPTHGPSAEADAATSRDPGARLFTYLDEAGDLWVGRADGGRDQRIFTQAPAWTARWSPSGSQLAVSAGIYDDPDLWIVPSGGGNPRLLGRGAWPVWSPDEQTLVFSERTPRGDGSERLYMSGADGSRRRFLTAGVYARWSPDSRYLAFLRPLGGWYGADCPNLVLLVRDMEREQDTEIGPAGTSFAWLPDSTLVFPTAVGDLERFVPGSGVTTLAAGAGARHCQAPFVAAPSGSFVAYVTQSDQLGLLDPDSGRTRLLPRARPVCQYCFNLLDEELRIAPDEQSIIYLRRESGAAGRMRLLRVRLDTGDIDPLVEAGPFGASLFSSSPDQRFVVAGDDDKGGRHRLIVIDLATGTRGDRYGSNTWPFGPLAWQPFPLAEERQIYRDLGHVDPVNLDPYLDTLVVAGGVIVSAPRTDGSYVVWAVGAEIDGTRRSYIYAEELRDRQAFRVAPSTNVQSAPAIADGLVAWIEGPAGESFQREVRARDLLTGREFTVAATGAQAGPAVGDGWIAWVQMEQRPDGGPVSIMARDLRSTRPPLTVASFPAGSYTNAGSLRFSGRRLTWMELQPISGVYENLIRIRSLLLDSGKEPETLLEQRLLNAPTVAAAGDLVAVGSFALSDVFVFDLSHGTRMTVAREAWLKGVDGGRIIWSSYEPATSSWSFWAYDTRAGARFRILLDPFASELSVSGGMLLWAQRRASSTETHTRPLRDFLPSAPRPDSGPSGPNQSFFAATGHTLAFGFKAFWEANGGLPVFGYPLTREFERVDPGGIAGTPLVDRQRTTQVLERQVFEYHPEQQGTPYEVELSRLGVEDARRRDLWASATFQPTLATEEPGCTFFPETRHRVCGAFRDYWTGHGLEFGDPGISYRESVALFGFPISEPFSDPATGRQTQYFERARFEQHPENPAESQVLLGRLGAEVLAGWGW